MNLSTDETRAIVPVIWEELVILTRQERNGSLLPPGKERLEKLRGVLERMLFETAMQIPQGERKAAGLSEAVWTVLPLGYAPEVSKAIETGSDFEINGERYRVIEAALDTTPSGATTYRARMVRIPPDSLSYAGTIKTDSK